MRGPRRRRRWRFDRFDVALGPDHVVCLPGDREDYERALGAWYAAAGAEWEARFVASRPGCRSWCWWRFVAGEAPPWADSDSELVRLFELGEVGNVEAQVLLATGDRHAALGQVAAPQMRTAALVRRLVPAREAVHNNEGGRHG